MAPSTQAEYNKLKVSDLKDLLTARSLPTNGIKSELIQRLLTSDAESPATGAADTEVPTADDYEVNWEEDDTTKTPAKPAAEAPAPAPGTEPVIPANGRAAETEKVTAAEPKVEEPVGEKKKFVFKSLAAQFEEEEAKKKAEAEAKKAAAAAAAAEKKDAAPAAGSESLEKPGRIAAEFVKPSATTDAATTSTKNGTSTASIDAEIEKLKKRAERFGTSVEDNETLKRLERARKFAAEAEAGEGDGKGANAPRLLKVLDQALPDRKRRGENTEGGRGGKRQRGRGGREGGRREGGDKPKVSSVKASILADPEEKRKAEERAKRFASAA